MSLGVFFTDLDRLFVPRDEDCLKVIIELRWGGEVSCPHCQSGEVIGYGSYRRGEIEVPRYRCKGCGSTFSPLTGTIFERHKLSLGEMFYIIRFLPNMSINEIASSLSLDFEAVKNFADEAMRIAHGEVSLERLCAIVELDEIYVNSGEKGKRGV